MAPGIGIGADLANAGLYASEGNWLDAGLSLLGVIPLLGDALGAGRNVLKYGDDVAGAVAHVGGATRAASRQADAIVASSRASDEAAYLYMYTGPEQLARMSTSGLGSRYLAPNGHLTPIQAQIELALPWYNPGTVVMRVPASAVEAGVVLERRVTGNVFGRGGGGLETVLDQRPPLSWFEPYR